MSLGTPRTAPDLWETATDPDLAFQAEVPRGWRHRLRTVRAPPMSHSLVVSERPDGRASLFSGDPTLPMFLVPGTFPMAGAVVRPPTSIEHFLPEYAHHRFGSLPGMRILAMNPWPPLFERTVARFQQRGVPLTWATAGRLDLAFRDPAGSEVRVMLLGATWSLAPTWTAEIHGASVAAPDDPGALAEALLGLVSSLRVTPAEQARFDQERAASAAAHRATMASIERNTAALQANHQQNMATLRGMADAHQQRMAGMWQANDAAFEGWRAQQASADRAAAAPIGSDDAHRSFLNLIAEERTVVDGEGHEHQVAAGYDRYFYRKADRTWVGTRSHEDLTGIPGLDPTTFEEVRIRR